MVIIFLTPDYSVCSLKQKLAAVSAFTLTITSLIILLITMMFIAQQDKSPVLSWTDKSTLLSIQEADVHYRDLAIETADKLIRVSQYLEAFHLLTQTVEKNLVINKNKLDWGLKIKAVALTIIKQDLSQLNNDDVRTAIFPPRQEKTWINLSKPYLKFLVRETFNIRKEHCNTDPWNLINPNSLNKYLNVVNYCRTLAKNKVFF